MLHIGEKMQEGKYKDTTSQLFANIKLLELLINFTVTYLLQSIWYFSIICGITEDTNSAHIIKAALQAVCFQTRDILEAMKQDTGLPLSKLLVDGAMTANNLLMQMQADICGIPVGKNQSFLLSFFFFSFFL